MKVLRRLFKVLVALVLVLVVAAVALVFVFDPNMFKPRLESMAREQGVALEIDGNLGWQLWPALGVEVNDISVAALDTPSQTIARLDRAGLELALGPLLRGELAVHHVRIGGAELDLRVDEQGRGNWEALLPEAGEAEPAPETPEAPAGDDGALVLAVDEITLSDASLRYRDAGSGQDLSLSPLNLSLTGFNLQGVPFDLSLGWRARIAAPEMLGDRPLTLDGELGGRLTLAEDFDNAALDGGRLQLGLSRAGASDDISLTLNARADQLLSAPSYSAELNLRPFSPRILAEVLSLPLPPMADEQALDRLAFSAELEGTPERLSLDPLTLELDETRLEGRVAVTDISRAAVEASLSGNKLNLDRYLPPPSDEPEEPAAETTGDETLIPLEPIRVLALDLAVDFDELIASGLTVSDIRLHLRADEGLVQLERAELNAYEGQLQAQGQLDAQGETARIGLTGQLEGLSLEPLLTDLEMSDDLQLSGALNADVRAATLGVTRNQLVEAMDAEANFAGDKVRLAPMNIEGLFCEAMARIGEPTASYDRDWPDYTELAALSGRVVMLDQIITLESLEAGVERLAVTAKGQLNLDESRYNITLPIRLGSERTSADGCRVSSNYWIDRSLSLLRCRGSLEELNLASDCGLDSDGFKSLTRDYAEYRARQEYEEKLDKEKARAREKLDEEKQELKKKAREELLDEEDEEKVKDALKGLFN